MARRARARRRSADRHLPRLLDQRRLLHLDRPRGRPPRLEPAGRGPPGARCAAAPAPTPASLARAREEIFIAEGSDWFWWYGDDHSSEHDLEFDDLFRRHLRNVYRALDRPIPEELFVTQHHDRRRRGRWREPPSAFIRPTIDGEVTSYFEWLGAGSLELRGAARRRCTRSRRRAGAHRLVAVRLRHASVSTSGSTSGRRAGTCWSAGRGPA